MFGIPVLRGTLRFLMRTGDRGNGFVTLIGEERSRCYVCSEIFNVTVNQRPGFITTPH